MRAALEHDPLVIVEAGAAGLEVECSVLGNGDPIASQPGEIVLAAGGAAGTTTRPSTRPGGMELIVPARISERCARARQELAVQVFVLSGCAGSRGSTSSSRASTVLVNELNTMPGFTETSVYAALFGASGIPYPELLDRLVALGARALRGRARAPPLAAC